jgi:ABC-type uncharacterized transport system substrate-binding protein
MKRYEIVSLITATAMIWPLPLSAQQPAKPVIGVLNSGPAALRPEQLQALERGLKEAGYLVGQNVTIEYRGADNHYDRLPALAAELVRRQVAVIVAAGGPVSALAARAETKSIPIVFTTIADPVKSGLVASLNRPGGNVTGIAGFTSELDPKRLEMLHQVKPTAGAIGMLINPNRPSVDDQAKHVQAAARALGRQVVVQKAGSEQEIDTAFETLAREPVDALLVTADPFFSSRRTQVVALAARYALPAIYQWREIVAAGGLMSYGPIIGDAYHQTGIYVARILKGAATADLPVVQPTRFELVINLRTAEVLKLKIPATLLARADDVIE